MPGFPVYGVGQPTEKGFAKIPEKVFSQKSFCLERVVLNKIFSPLRLGRRRRFGSIADRSLLHMSMEFQSLLGDHMHAYGSDSPGRGFWPKCGIFLKKVEPSCDQT